MARSSEPEWLGKYRDGRPANLIPSTNRVRRSLALLMDVTNAISTTPSRLRLSVVPVNMKETMAHYPMT